VREESAGDDTLDTTPTPCDGDPQEKRRRALPWSLYGTKTAEKEKKKGKSASMSMPYAHGANGVAGGKTPDEWLPSHCARHTEGGVAGIESVPPSSNRPVGVSRKGHPWATPIGKQTTRAEWRKRKRNW